MTIVYAREKKVDKNALCLINVISIQVFIYICETRAVETQFQTQNLDPYPLHQRRTDLGTLVVLSASRFRYIFSNKNFGAFVFPRHFPFKFCLLKSPLWWVQKGTRSERRNENIKVLKMRVPKSVVSPTIMGHQTGDQARTGGGGRASDSWSRYTMPST